MFRVKKTSVLLNKVDVGAAIRLRDSMQTTLKFRPFMGKSGGFKGSFWGKFFPKSRFMWKSFFTYQEAGKIQLIREYGQLLSGGVHRYWNSGESQSAAGNSWEHV